MFKVKQSTLFTGCFAALWAAETLHAETLNDTLPSLSTVTEIDAEQMRLARAVHKKILETQQKEAKSEGDFTAYSDKMLEGIEFKMMPVKAKPFVWKGEKEADVLEVTLDDYWMASHETSWAAYEAFYATELLRKTTPLSPHDIAS